MTCPHRPRWPNGHMVESLSLSLSHQDLMLHPWLEVWLEHMCPGMSRNMHEAAWVVATNDCALR